MKYKNLIFDTDGTIIESLPDIINAFNKALKECGHETTFSVEEGKDFIGSGTKEFTRKAIQKANLSKEDVKKITPLFAKYYQEMQCDTTRPFDGIVELLEELKSKGIKLFIASNKPHAFLIKIIDKIFPEDLFEDMIGQIEGNKMKPDPQIVNIIVDKYHLDKKETLFVGDSIYDVQTARNAKIDCLLVTYGYGEYTRELLAEADYVINSVEELKDFCK